MTSCDINVQEVIFLGGKMKIDMNFDSLENFSLNKDVYEKGSTINNIKLCPGKYIFIIFNGICWADENIIKICKIKKYAELAAKIELDNLGILENILSLLGYNKYEYRISTSSSIQEFAILTLVFNPTTLNYKTLYISKVISRR